MFVYAADVKSEIFNKYSNLPKIVTPVTPVTRVTPHFWGVHTPTPRKLQSHQRTSGVSPAVCRGPWGFLRDTGSETRRTLLAGELPA